MIFLLAGHVPYVRDAAREPSAPELPADGGVVGGEQYLQTARGEICQREYAWFYRRQSKNTCV